MAKQPQLNLKDILISQADSNLKMSSTIKAQLRSQMNLEKVAQRDQVLQTIQVAEAIKSQKEEVLLHEDNQNLIKEVKKTNKILESSMKSKTGDQLNSNVLKMSKIIKEQNEYMRQNSREILGKSGEKQEFKSIGQRFGGVVSGMKDFFTARGFLDKIGLVKRGTGGMFSNALDAAEQRKQQAAARIASGELATDPKTGRMLNKNQSAKIFEQQAKQEQAMRRKQGDLERSIESKYRPYLSKEKISQTPEFKELQKLALDLAKVNPSLRPADDRIIAGPKAPRDSDNTSEEEMDQEKRDLAQTDLLKKIEENTRRKETKPVIEKQIEEKKGGLFSGLRDMFKTSAVGKMGRRLAGRSVGGAGWLSSVGGVGSIAAGAAPLAVMGVAAQQARTADLNDKENFNIFSSIARFGMKLGGGDPAQKRAQESYDDYVKKVKSGKWNKLDKSSTSVKRWMKYGIKIDDSMLAKASDVQKPKLTQTKPLTAEPAAANNIISDTGNIIPTAKGANDANSVYDKSVDSKESQMKPKEGSKQTVISAPTTTINKTSQNAVFRSNPRNQDTTVNSYYKSRYVQ